MKMRCPKCKRDVSVEPRSIAGKTTAVCPHCGYWDSDKDVNRLMRRWAVQICRSCLNYKPVQDMWRAPSKRMCAHEDELTIQDRTDILHGECRFFKPITLEALQGGEDNGE